MPEPNPIFCANCGRLILRPRRTKPIQKYCGLECRAIGRRIKSPEDMSLRTRFRRRREMGLVKELRDRSFSHSFFRSWTPGLAWVLGLIWSDGYLSRRGNAFEVCSKDLDLLETVAKLTGANDNIREYKTGKGGQFYRIMFASKEVADVLRALGLTPAKSLTACWPEMPEEFRPDFVRGLIDGDGSVNLRFDRDRPGQQVADLSICLYSGSPHIIKGYTDWLDGHEIAFCCVQVKPTLAMITVRKQESCRKLHGLLYWADDVPCLARKREPFDRWMITPRGKAGNPRMSCHSSHHAREKRNG